jgi:hypothetical protein
MKRNCEFIIIHYYSKKQLFRLKTHKKQELVQKKEGMLKKKCKKISKTKREQGVY